MSLTSKNDWTDLLKLWEQFDSCFQTNYRTKIRRYYSALLTIHIIFILSQSIWFYFPVFYVIYVPLIYVYEILIFFQFVVIELAVEHYRNLNVTLENTVMLKISEYRRQKRGIKNIYFQFGILHDITNFINKLFGWPCLLIHVKCIIVSLNTFNNLFNVNGTGWEVLLNFIHLLTVMVSKFYFWIVLLLSTIPI